MFATAPDEGLSDQDDPAHQISPVKLSALHHVRIRRLQSEIQDRLYRLPDSDPPAAEPWTEYDTWIQAMSRRIREWRASAPPGTGFCSKIWLDLNYHITITLLHRPSPRNPKPSREALITARQGASGVMRTYKEMLKAGRINWSESDRVRRAGREPMTHTSGWLSMYQLFIAGIAYLNSLWQAADQGWTIVDSYVEALLDVQVCTSVMSSLSGEWSLH